MANSTITSLGNYQFKGKNLNNAVIQNGIAYLAAGEQGLMLIDVKTPNNPKLLKQLDTLGYVYDVAIVGKTAFLASENDGLKIVDVSTPTEPKILTTFTDSIANLQNIAVAKNIAYLADWENGLHIVDVRNIAAPILLETLPIPDANSVILTPDNSLAFVLSHASDLTLIDVKNPNAPITLKTLQLGNDVRDIAVIDNNTLAVAAGDEGLKIVSIADTSAPKIITTFPINTSQNVVSAVSAMDNKTLVVTNGTKSMVIVDVSNPNKPKITDTIATTSDTTEFVFDNGLLYSLNHSTDKQGIQIFTTSAAALQPKTITETQISPNNPNFRGVGEKADNVKGSEKNDSIWGGSGNDTLKGGVGNDTLDGYNGDDKLFGETENDSLIGGIGDDTLNGGEGDDTLEGNAGNDILDGGEGADQMTGGEGDDYYVIDNVTDRIIEDTSSKSGNDTVEIHVPVPSSFVGVENYIVKNEGNIDVSGDNTPNKIVGDIGNNYLRGFGGNDTLIGGSGNDTLEGGEGIDQLDGGEGDDIYIIDNEEDQIIDTQGKNRVQSSKTISIATYDAITNLELIGNDAINGTGNDNNNILEGNDNNNRLDGRKGNDTVNGFGGDDTLIGGSGGNDVLDGGNGDDIVIYNKPKQDYGEPQFIDGVYVITEIGSGDKDELHDVEYLKFSDTEQPIPLQSTTQKTLTLSVGDVFVTEGNEAILTLKLNEPPTEKVTISLQTVDSTAKKGIDYDDTFLKSVVFTPTQTNQTVKIKTKQNTLVEDDKKFMVNVSTTDKNVEISTPTSFVTIGDDDKPTLSISNAKITEGQTGKSSVDITVSLSAVAKQTVKVHYETRDGTATKLNDYEPKVGDLEITAGKKTAKMTISIINDDLKEQIESFFVTLSNPTNATLNPKKSVATVEITDNDNHSSSAMQIGFVGIHNDNGNIL